MASLINAVVFPGQGSQYLSMLENYFLNEPTFKEIFETSVSRITLLPLKFYRSETMCYIYLLLEVLTKNVIN